MAKTLIDDFEAAHDETTEQNYGGIPVEMIRFTEPEDLEDFVRGNTGVNQGVFDTSDIEEEVSDGNNAQPEDNTIPGVSATWQNLYERSVSGEIIPIPYHDVKVSDPQTLQTLTRMYRLFYHRTE